MTMCMYLSVYEQLIRMYSMRKTSPFDLLLQGTNINDIPDSKSVGWLGYQKQRISSKWPHACLTSQPDQIPMTTIAYT